MKRMSICAAALGIAMGLSSMTAEAMPQPAPTVTRSSDVQQVAKVVVRYGYYRGHRGYRYRRPGYRYYGGFWYPPVAFVGPAIVVRPAPVVVVRPGRHWRWCGPRWNRHRCYW